MQNGGHEAINPSLLQCAIWNEKQHLFAAVRSVIYTPAARLTTPVEQYKNAEGVVDANGRGLYVTLRHGRMVTIAERFPKIDPRPYWIRYWVQMKVPHTEDEWEYVADVLLRAHLFFVGCS